MVCQRECFNCDTTDDVRWRESIGEYLCDECFEYWGK